MTEAKRRHIQDVVVKDPQPNAFLYIVLCSSQYTVCVSDERSYQKSHVSLHQFRNIHSTQVKII